MLDGGVLFLVVFPGIINEVNGEVVILGVTWDQVEVGVEDRLLSDGPVIVDGVHPLDGRVGITNGAGHLWQAGKHVLG